MESINTKEYAPKISVICPVYNVEKYLNYCINSVLIQSFTDFELICIDDCSTDNSYFYLKLLAKRDKRIKILKNETNKGVGYSRNRGLDEAKGKYIFFIDSDDWIDSNTLKTLYDLAEKENLEVLMFKYMIFKSNDFIKEKWYEMEFMNPFIDKVFNHKSIDPKKLFSLPNVPGNKLYLRSFLENNNIRFPQDICRQEDNQFFFNVITHAERVSLIDEHFYNYRNNPNSIMNKHDKSLL